MDRPDLVSLNRPQVVNFTGACNIDGTLVGMKSKTIPKSAVEAITLLKQKGVKVFIATGRSIGFLDDVKHLSFDGFVCFNGGICASSDGEILHRERIHREDIEALLRHNNSHGVCFTLIYEDRIFVSNINSEVLEIHERLHNQLPSLLDFSCVDTENVLQVNVFIGPQDERQFMEAVMPNSLASRWSPLFTDVNGKGLSKHTGMDIFCKHFDIDISETMAFGDGGNDLAMIKEAGIGIAMANGNESVKKIADYITDDAENDGIWNALKHFKII